MFLTHLFLFSTLFFNSLDDLPKDRSLFISPVKIPLALSANFGELRIDHFHSGLDIKTQGVTGKEVVAAASGYIYRIGVSPGGFGKVLYIKHPSGYSTVYGHLEKFTPEIDDYVKTRQYERKSFQVTLFPPAEKFSVKQGDLIAYSGNSGASGGPHLHYEIRHTDSEKPVNPLLFEFGTTDDIKPVFERLVIYPTAKNSSVNGQNNLKKISVEGNNGKYFISPANSISISGPAGFGIKSYDLLNDSYNKCAVYSTEVRIDSNTIFRYVMDEFAFSESRYINSHIDYQSYMNENTYYERAFVLPNDRLSLYDNKVNRGIFNFTGNEEHLVEIIITDAHKNTSILTFMVKGEPAKEIQAREPLPEEIIRMPFNSANIFRAENIMLFIPSGALYDTIGFTYKKGSGTPQMLSDVHHIHNINTPVHKAYTISIKPSQIPSGKESKLLMVQMSNDFKKSPLSSTFNEGYVTAEAMSFGMFYVGIDTVSPSIYTNGLFPGADLSGRSELRIRITDDLSGIKGYEPQIDGKWALFEYDQKNDLLIYRFDPERIVKGSDHTLSLKVFDNKNNINEFTTSFRW
jgi:hypothetical protein